MLEAATTSSSGGSGFTFLILMVVLIGFFYVFMIRPQSKRRRESQAMQSTLGPGSEVVTIGGLHGTVESVDEETVSLEIADGVVVRFAKAAIGQVKTAGRTDEDEAAEEAEDEPELVEAEAVEVEEPEPVVADTLVEEPVTTPAADTRKKD